MQRYSGVSTVCRFGTWYQNLPPSYPRNIMTYILHAKCDRFYSHREAADASF